MQKKKVLLIGWDACEWKVVDELIGKGLMPTLQKFLKDGTSGKIATLEPPISPMLWTSIATGKRPEAHGITGFLEPDTDLNSKSGVRPVLVTSRKVKAIWNILNQEGYKSNIIGWWPSHPAEPINGCMVSNFYPLSRVVNEEKWTMIEGTVYPKRLAEELVKLRVHFNEFSGPVIKNFIPGAEKVDQDKEKVLFNVVNTLGHACSIHNAATYLIENEPADFTAIYYDAMDHFSHAAMKYHPPKMPHIDQEKYNLYNGIVTAAYRFHDMMLERLLELVDDDTTVMIISDHGFHPDHLRPVMLPKEPSGPTYEHSPYGFFAVKGPGIAKNKKIFGGSVIDITPTVLSIYDLPVARDMKGRVLNDIYEIPKKINFIDSWENVEGETGMHATEQLRDPKSEHEAMNQLIELGYVEELSEDKSKNIKSCIDESNYNLARGFIHTNRHQEAMELLEVLSKENNHETRFSIRLFNCYLQLGKINEATELIRVLREINKGNLVPGIELSEGLLEMAKNNTVHATELFKRLLVFDPNSSQTYIYIAQSYARRHFYPEAEEHFRKALECDPQSIFAMEGLAYILFKTDRHEEALDQLMNLVEITFYFPRAHALMGEILLDAGYYEKAAESFEVALNMNNRDIKSRKRLIKIYSEHIKNEDKLKFHQTILDQLILGEIIVVTGLPRSGMSLVMQMLEKAGIELFYDDNKKKDEFNPNGYFESSLSKLLSFDKTWLKQANGKAIRISCDLIEFLPENFNYKVIYITRDFNEVLKSTMKTERRFSDAYLNSFPVLLAESFSKYNSILQKALESRLDLDLLELNFNNLIENPEIQVEKICEFLGKGKISEIKSVINSDLYLTKAVGK